MKSIIVAVALTFTTGVYVSSVKADDEMKTRENLRLVSGESQKTSEALLVAIEQGSRDAIKQHMKELIDFKKVDLVVSLLDDPSDVVKQEAAQSLSNVKSKKVANTLVVAMSKLHVSVRGGDEAQILRSETKKAFKEALVNITETKIDERWTEGETMRHLEKAVKSMRD
jgi:hypothetical protein